MNQTKMNREKALLIFSVFIAGLCSIIYELLISTISSYFMGDSVKQFSVTIGIYLAAMGLGSYVSRIFKTRLLEWFIAVEILLGLLGGLSVPILYLAFAYTDIYYPVMLTLIMGVGLLTGLEIPLLTRIMDEFDQLRVNLSNVLSFDYLGGLLATLLFPFLILPFVGTFKSALFFGLLNMCIGFVNLWYFSDLINTSRRRVLQFASFSVSGLLLLVLILSNTLLAQWSSAMYEDRIIYTEQTPYQKIIITQHKRDLRLFLNGNLQFASIDEYRYHEALVHVPLSMATHPKNVLLLGGGDGLAVREFLKYPEIEKITVVDLDPSMTRLAKENSKLVALNENSLEDQRVQIFHEDASVFLNRQEEFYDVIIADLPDPNNESLARLYSVYFYKLVQKKLSKGGIFVTQATSPYYAREAFWCIEKTMTASGFRQVLPYHAYVPSFGDWGFVLGSSLKVDKDQIKLKVPTSFLTDVKASQLFDFEKDILADSVRVSTLDQPEVLDYYEKGWEYWR